MKHYKAIFGAMLLLLCCAACTRAVRVPLEEGDVRASFSAAPVEARETGISPALREEMRMAIIRYLMHVGTLPRKAVMGLELISVSADPSARYPGQRYHATAQLGDFNSTHQVNFLVIERRGELLVRKIS